METPKVGDLWGYCTGECYIVAKVKDREIDLINVATDRYFEDYPIERMKGFLNEQSGKMLWELLSRPK